MTPQQPPSPSMASFHRWRSRVPFKDTSDSPGSAGHMGCSKQGHPTLCFAQHRGLPRGWPRVFKQDEATAHAGLATSFHLSQAELLLWGWTASFTVPELIVREKMGEESL